MEGSSRRRAGGPSPGRVRPGDLPGRGTRPAARSPRPRSTRTSVPPRVPARDPTFEGLRVDSVGGPFHDGAEARLRLADGPQLRDVDEARDDDPLIAEVHRLSGQERPPDFADPRTDRHLLVADRAELPEPFADGLPPVG